MKLTNKEFLEKELEMGVSPFNPKFVKLATNTVNQLIDYKDLSVIDFGAGTGVYSKALLDAGFDVAAQDIFKEHRDFMKENYADLKVIARPVKADLMLFIETAEHMEDLEIVKAIQTIDPKVILFSSTSDDFSEEWGHVNVKPQSEWVRFWKELGYKKVKDLNKPTKWTFLLERV